MKDACSHTHTHTRTHIHTHTHTHTHTHVRTRTMHVKSSVSRPQPWQSDAYRKMPSMWFGGFMQFESVCMHRLVSVVLLDWTMRNPDYRRQHINQNQTKNMTCLSAMIKSQRLWFNEINKYCTSVCLHARSVFSISERVNDAQYKLISA